ncbi:NUDIX domain-containing protein [Candidatus Parcubacteria bacterium]|nr:NUDIX domain-containing protein [Candidatus Parcubacteria bacterium]
MNKNFIPEDLYKKIIHNVPLCCVDIVVKLDNSFLLAKRTEEPVKSKWWFPGGRVLFNEKLETTAKRKLKQELNIKKVRKIEFLGAEGIRFKKGDFGKPVYSIGIVFLAEIDKKQANDIRLDHTASEYKWFSGVQRSFHPYLKRFLKKSLFN